jgi:hypothetical protein
MRAKLFSTAQKVMLCASQSPAPSCKFLHKKSPVMLSLRSTLSGMNEPFERDKVLRRLSMTGDSGP